MKRIAYLAPEIPALSATFVYNEILALQDHGCLVIPISVHVPSSPASGKRPQILVQHTRYLYRKGMFDFCMAALLCCGTSPVRFLRVLKTVFRDAYQIGLMNRTGIGLFYRFLAACRVATILLNNDCKHLHVHFAHVPTEIAMYASLLTGVPFSFTSHANDLFERGRLLKEKIARSHFAVTISEYNREFLVAQGGQRDKIHIVRCGVDSNKFFSVPLKKPTQPFHIGTIGRMVEKKGFDTLLQATSLLHHQGLNFRLTIAGSGPLENHLHDLAQQLNINTIVDFPGAIENDEVSAWLHTLDLFVLPCRKDSHNDMDGIPVVLMEAMLSGIPVVSTHISGIPELIANEQEGLLIPPDDPAELAQAMKRLLMDNELRYCVYQNGIHRVTTEFDTEHNTNRLLHLLQA
jgi:glycosyltransferase involved in cell wall biosynthesis